MDDSMHLQYDDLPSQRIHNHEDHLIEHSLRPAGIAQNLYLFIAFLLFETGQTRQKWLVWEEACRKDQHRNGYENVREGESRHAEVER